MVCMPCAPDEKVRFRDERLLNSRSSFVAVLVGRQNRAAAVPDVLGGDQAPSLKTDWAPFYLTDR
jgi:hypothetical protein